MTHIQTLYIDSTRNLYKDSFGWLAPEYHIMSWVLSCLQLNKVYGSVQLYCNSKGAKLLIDELQLPYKKVHTTHDKLIIPDKNLWALPKLYTYSLQKEPFLHVDGDVFLFKKLPSKLLESNLIAQNIEEATDYYLQTQMQLTKNFKYLPKCVKTDFKSSIPIKAVNAGILGGSNIDFFKNYTELAFKYVYKNADYFDSINVNGFNVFFEQHLFYSLAKEKNLKVNFLINSTFKDNQYLNLGNFYEVPCKRNYLHLLGDYKRDIHTCRAMELKLKELYPDYYNKVIALAQKMPEHFTSFLQDNEQSKKTNISTPKVLKHKKTKAAGVHKTKPPLHNLKILKFLNLLINKTELNDKGLKSQMKLDLAEFSNSLIPVVNGIKLTNECLHNRDLDSMSWFCKVLGDDASIMKKVIIACSEITVIKSKYDWAGLNNKYNRKSVRYYEELEMTTGEFYSIVIPEVFEEGFSLEDIDEMEFIMLSHLKKAMRISVLFKLMQGYVEKEVIKNHLNEYKALFLEMIKQLIIKKAIRPINK